MGTVLSVIFLVAVAALFIVGITTYKEKFPFLFNKKSKKETPVPVVVKVPEVCLTGDCADPAVTTCAGSCCDTDGKPCNVGAKAVKINLSPINDPKDNIRPGVFCALSKGAKVDIEIEDPDGNSTTTIQWFDVGIDGVDHLLPATGNEVYHRFAFNHKIKVMVTVDQLRPVEATAKSL